MNLKAKAEEELTAVVPELKVVRGNHMPEADGVFLISGGHPV